MQDVQNSPAPVALPIDRVGVSNIKLPIVVSDKTRGRQHTTALADLGVDLPAAFKGTHMSRFLEALENWNEELSYQSIKNLLADVKNRLEARKAYACFHFTYFLRKKAPVSGSSGLMGYSCSIMGELESQKLELQVTVEVPVMTVCPCSKAISDEGAHSQRALVRIKVGMRGFMWLEELIEIAESAGSSPVYPVLKRNDEKKVTESSFANPCFVEDVVRNVASRLVGDPHLSWFRVEVESMESIHDHNAFAHIEHINSQS